MPRRSSKIEVYVEVLDENDNDPVFDFGNSDYGLQVEVQENTASGTVIANVKATDLDSGENGKITYFLDKRSASTGGGILPSDIIDRFKIHPDTGELTVEENLDREEQASYNLIVQAYDNYQYGKCKSPILEMDNAFTFGGGYSIFLSHIVINFKTLIHLLILYVD